ncbi:hypothetical protein ACFY7H_12855 [Streptomyces sp. NPDC012794]|uniref:hypothetical protein n=1 Tax=Streptomyces sp. NPDC012794 TaxID=3364850 RepID=UPI00369BC232
MTEPLDLPSWHLWAWLLRHGADPEKATELMNGYAHELAERIREHEYDAGEVGPVHLAFQAAADVIDPSA